MDVVTDTGAVRGVVVVAKDGKGVNLAAGDAGDHRDEVARRLGGSSPIRPE
jgi:hypothetical protein